MIKTIIGALLLLHFSTLAMAVDLPDSSELPRMPDAYRNNDYRDFSKRNPYGMSIYDRAEIEAENEYSETVVVPLEESQRILKKRKEIAKEKQDIILNQGVSK